MCKSHWRGARVETQAVKKGLWLGSDNTSATEPCLVFFNENLIKRCTIYKQMYSLWIAGTDFQLKLLI